MRKLIIIFSFSFLMLFTARPVLAFAEENLSSRLAGKILLDVASNGEAWYVYPGDFHRYYLGKPSDAYNIMRNLSLGVSNDKFLEISSSTPDRFIGLVLLKPDDLGKAYYVNPDDKQIIYLANGDDAFTLMKSNSLGITTVDLEKIPIGKIFTDNLGVELSREWQYLGWWGRVIDNKVPVKTEVNGELKNLGYLSYNNKIKILNKKNFNGRAWYLIDGGKYPGSYIDAEFVKPIPQPTVASKIIIPSKVKLGEYWIDVNLGSKVMTLFKYDKVIMTTYIAIGLKDTPTILGDYNVWLKYKKTRMRSAPNVLTHQYDLLDVPWVMYYKGSYSIHGTYWHDNFGEERSAGCTNATQGDSKFLFDITSPQIGDLESIRPTASTPGVLITNHY